MAGANGRRGGDRVLESRHLVGLFLGVVLLCGVFFTLGYVMGRTQYGGPVHAASGEKNSVLLPKPATEIPGELNPQASNPNAGEWDFYSRGKKSNQLEAPSNSQPKGTHTVALPAKAHPGETTLPVADARASAASSKALARFQPPRIPRGAVVLQLAALTRESDALALADALQQKRFPSFVVTPTTDNLYRVQLGPYADLAAAEQARRSVEREGFKTIIKR